jgi:hypothetical protein
MAILGIWTGTDSLLSAEAYPEQIITLPLVTPLPTLL